MGELWDSSWPLTLLGAYFTTFSIFVVYQILELQTWLERVSVLKTEFDANQDKFKGASADAKACRKNLRERCSATKGRYPGFATWLLGALQTSLFVIGLFLSTWVPNIPKIYLLAAWGLLAAATIAGPALGRRRGVGDIGEVERKLQEWEQ